MPGHPLGYPVQMRWIPSARPTALLLVLPLGLPACGSGSGTLGPGSDTGAAEADADADGDADADADADGDSDTDTDADPDRPVILDADAWCYLHDEGEDDEVQIWQVSLQASDPQGDSSIESIQPEGVTVLSGDTALATYDMVCTDNAVCVGSWSATEDNIGCITPEDYTVRMVIVDDDGNSSEPAEVEGRKGTDASG